MYDMKGDILRIGCLDNAEIIRALSDAVKVFEQQYSDTFLKIELYNFKDLREQIVCGELDIVVAYSFGFGDYYNICTKKLRKLDTYIAISMHSPLAESHTLPVEGLRNEMLVLLTLAEIKEPEQRAIKTCKKLGFTPKGIKYMPSYFALEMAVKNNRGFTICGSNITDRFGSDIKIFKIPEPDKEQFAILAYRNNDCSDLAEQFINAIPDLT
jgi:DNA-binding transcriptional LysR family regulator